MAGVQKQRHALCFYLNASWHTKAETKWPPFPWRHFRMHFLECYSMNFDCNLTDVCSWGSNLQYTSTASCNGLAPIRRQAIIWINDGQVCWRIYASLGLNELICNTRGHVVHLCRHLLTHWGRDFADDIFKCIFLTENILLSIAMSLMFVPKCPNWQ